MAFSIDTHNLPYFRTYEQAKNWHDEVVPIRGTTIRPLGDRRKKHIRIEAAPPKLNGAKGIACVLYGTPCVTYYSDGTIHLRHDSYITQSTCKFINRVIPVSDVYADSQRNCLVVRVAGGDYKCGENGLWLRQKDSGYEPFDCDPFAVTKVNRKVMREVRKQYAEAMTYCIGLGKLTQWEKPTLVDVDKVDRGRHSAGETLEGMASDDVERWASAYTYLMWHSGVAHSHYDYQAKRWVDEWRCDARRMEATLARLIKWKHASEVLVREYLPLGVHKKDTNYRYARGVWSN